MFSVDSYPYIYVRQAALWCFRCGLCSPCYTREFAGLRPRVIARDHGACRVSGRLGVGKKIHVHHRRPGVFNSNFNFNSNSNARFLITLCPGHQALIHRLEVFDRILPALALELWREQHPGASEQLALDFDHARESNHIYSRQFWEVPA